MYSDQILNDNMLYLLVKSSNVACMYADVLQTDRWTNMFRQVFTFSHQLANKHQNAYLYT